MHDAFTEPTSENVRNSCSTFDGWKDNPDPALTELFKQYPKNTDLEHVMLKVVALNAFYSTQIPIYSERIPTVYDVARHIVARKIDVELELGSEDLVHKIAYMTKEKETRFNYSFATKYCNWHKPKFYPIWDSRVDAYLWELRNRETGKPEGLRQFKRKELWKYPTFKQVVRDFRTHFKLEAFTFKEIDKFLYCEGRRLFERTANSSGSVTESQQPPFLATELQRPSERGAPGRASGTWEFEDLTAYPLCQNPGFPLQSPVWRSRSTRERASAIFVSETSVLSKPLISISLRLLTSTKRATESIAWLR
jgi:hypothetical protein